MDISGFFSGNTGHRQSAKLRTRSQITLKRNVHDFVGVVRLNHGVHRSREITFASKKSLEWLLAAHDHVLNEGSIQGNIRGLQHSGVAEFADGAGKGNDPDGVHRSQNKCDPQSLRFRFDADLNPGVFLALLQRRDTFLHCPDREGLAAQLRDHRPRRLWVLPGLNRNIHPGNVAPLESRVGLGIELVGICRLGLLGESGQRGEPQGHHQPPTRTDHAWAPSPLSCCTAVSVSAPINRMRHPMYIHSMITMKPANAPYSFGMSEL